MENPWKKLSSEMKYSNPWIRVREDKVLTPSGTPGIYGVVEAVKIAVAVVAVNSAHEVYLVGQYRYPVEEYSWEVIEGGVEPGEDPLDGAKRELREEAGVTAETYTTLGPEIHLSNCFTDERGMLFLAQGLSEGVAAPDETELLKVKKVPFTEAMAMVDRGEIKDVLSIVALTRAASYLRRGLVTE